MGRDSQTGSWPGVFIAVEGIDGSGKSTVATAVVRRLRKELDREVILTREPGGTPLGEGVRDLVLSAASAGITPVAELLLFSAARAQHVSAVIEPHLRAGSIIVCDRFTDSTLAYQWGGRGLPRDTIAAAQAVATGGVAPDLRVQGDDGVHFEARVVFDGFAGKLPLARHRMVYATLGERMGGEIHALSLKTHTRVEAGEA